MKLHKAVRYAQPDKSVHRNARFGSFATETARQRDARFTPIADLERTSQDVRNLPIANVKSSLKFTIAASGALWRPLSDWASLRVG